MTMFAAYSASAPHLWHAAGAALPWALQPALARSAAHWAAQYSAQGPGGGQQSGQPRQLQQRPAHCTTLVVSLPYILKTNLPASHQVAGLHGMKCRHKEGCIKTILKRL